jgi:hypothetical protein
MGVNSSHTALSGRCHSSRCCASNDWTQQASQQVSPAAAAAVVVIAAAAAPAATGGVSNSVCRVFCQTFFSYLLNLLTLLLAAACQYLMQAKGTSRC